MFCFQRHEDEQSRDWTVRTSCHRHVQHPNQHQRGAQHNQGEEQHCQSPPKIVYACSISTTCTPSPKRYKMEVNTENCRVKL